MKKVLILLLLIFSSMAVFSSDLIIDSKTQTFSYKEKKIKLDGGVKVKLDNLTVESDRADVTIRRNNKLDTATFYDKPYAYEVNENKKREVKDLKVTLYNPQGYVVKEEQVNKNSRKVEPGTPAYAVFQLIWGGK